MQFVNDAPFHELMASVEPTEPQYSVTQFSKVDGDAYVAVGPTVKTIPPGYYVVAYDSNHGHRFIPKVVSTRDLIRFKGTITDEIIEEASKFWSLKDKYKTLGEPHKRGYLLYGPPGGGKTSLISFLSQEFIEQGNVVIDWTHAITPGLDTLKKIQPDQRILVIMEDIDGTINEFEQEVLQFLDGAQQHDNMLIVATTNHPNVLEGSIRNRPSRFDRVCFVDMPTHAERYTYIKKKTLNSRTPEQIESMVNDTEGFSLAHVKELIIATDLIGTSYKEALSRLKSLNSDGPKDNNKDYLKQGDIGFGFQKI